MRPNPRPRDRPGAQSRQPPRRPGVARRRQPRLPGPAAPGAARARLPRGRRLHRRGQALVQHAVQPGARLWSVRTAQARARARHRRARPAVPRPGRRRHRDPVRALAPPRRPRLHRRPHRLHRRPHCLRRARALHDPHRQARLPRHRGQVHRSPGRRPRGAEPPPRRALARGGRVRRPGRPGAARRRAAAVLAPAAPGRGHAGARPLRRRPRRLVAPAPNRELWNAVRLYTARLETPEPATARFEALAL